LNLAASELPTFRSKEGKMVAHYKVLQPHEVHASVAQQEFALDVLLGLSQSPKELSSKYFYDAEGDKLFQQIMELPEYYLTQCEFEILHTHKERIAEAIDCSCFNLVELGAGDGQKTRVLLAHFLSAGLDFRYIPIDISESVVQELVWELKQHAPSLEVEGLVTDYFDGLKWLSNLNHRTNVVLFLGSNIGNFSSSEARFFLHSLWKALNDGDYVYIGFDLKKNVDLMTKAYNDSTGVTAQFNLNLLRRINRELGANFDPDQFAFYSTYNEFSGAIESYLVSRRRQTVHIETFSQSFSFEPWEPLHTEYSHKYLESDIAQMATEAGFEVVEQFYDSRRYFLDSLWRVRKAR
jgi:L-histidine N-alpha-methyltransferase